MTESFRNERGLPVRYKLRTDIATPSTLVAFFTKHRLDFLHSSDQGFVGKYLEATTGRGDRPAGESLEKHDAEATGGTQDLK